MRKSIFCFAVILSLLISGFAWAEDTDSDRGSSHDRSGTRGFWEARNEYGPGGGHGSGHGQGGHNGGYGNHGGGHGEGGYNGEHHRPRTNCESLYHRIKHLKRALRHWRGHHNEEFHILVNELRKARFDYGNYCGSHYGYREGHHN